MAINVTCPGCHTRFTVGDQFAGKQGPCPKCKEVITIPSLEDEVVIHAPTPDGPTDSKGKSVLKTAKRKDAGFNPLVATGVAVAVLMTLLVAFILRGQQEGLLAEPAVLGAPLLLAGGALLLGPLLSWAGYQFLRDQELEPYSGSPLWIRAAACGAVYALCWLVYMTLANQLGDEFWMEDGLQMWQMVVAIAVSLGIGTFAGYVALDLDPAMAGFQCGLYFVATILLRIVMALPPLPGLIQE